MPFTLRAWSAHGLAHRRRELQLREKARRVPNFRCCLLRKLIIALLLQSPRAAGADLTSPTPPVTTDDSRSALPDPVAYKEDILRRMRMAASGAQQPAAAAVTPPLTTATISPASKPPADKTQTERSGDQELDGASRVISPQFLSSDSPAQQLSEVEVVMPQPPPPPLPFQPLTPTSDSLLQSTATMLASPLPSLQQPTLTPGAISENLSTEFAAAAGTDELLPQDRTQSTAQFHPVVSPPPPPLAHHAAVRTAALVETMPTALVVHDLAAAAVVPPSVAIEVERDEDEEGVPIVGAAAAGWTAGEPPPSGGEASALHALQRRTNHASHDAGAAVIAASAEMTGVKSLLGGDADAYALSRCDAKKWVVIGLAEDLLVDALVLSNEEKYSSSVASFRLLGSAKFPAAEWFVLGNFSAARRLGEQAFLVTAPAARTTYLRYLKVVWTAHHGSEFYCTWTRLRVYGTTAAEGFAASMVSTQAEVTSFKQQLEAAGAVTVGGGGGGSSSSSGSSSGSSGSGGGSGGSNVASPLPDPQHALHSPTAEAAPPTFSPVLVPALTPAALELDEGIESVRTKTLSNSTMLSVDSFDGDQEQATKSAPQSAASEETPVVTGDAAAAPRARSDPDIIPPVPAAVVPASDSGSADGAQSNSEQLTPLAAVPDAGDVGVGVAASASATHVTTATTTATAAALASTVSAPAAASASTAPAAVAAPMPGGGSGASLLSSPPGALRSLTQKLASLEIDQTLVNSYLKDLHASMTTSVARADASARSAAASVDDLRGRVAASLESSAVLLRSIVGAVSALDDAVAGLRLRVAGNGEGDAHNGASAGGVVLAAAPVLEAAADVSSQGAAPPDVGRPQPQAAAATAVSAAADSAAAGRALMLSGRGDSSLAGGIGARNMSQIEAALAEAWARFIATSTVILNSGPAGEAAQADAWRSAASVAASAAMPQPQPGSSWPWALRVKAGTGAGDGLSSAVSTAASSPASSSAASTAPGSSDDSVVAAEHERPPSAPGAHPPSPLPELTAATAEAATSSAAAAAIVALVLSGTAFLGFLGLAAYVAFAVRPRLAAPQTPSPLTSPCPTCNSPPAAAEDDPTSAGAASSPSPSAVQSLFARSSASSEFDPLATAHSEGSATSASSALAATAGRAPPATMRRRRASSHARR